MTKHDALAPTDDPRWRDSDGNELGLEDRALVYDVRTLVNRRGALGPEATGPVTEVPDETGGPYPGDGSNGVNVLDDSRCSPQLVDQLRLGHARVAR